MINPEYRKDWAKRRRTYTYDHQFYCYFSRILRPLWPKDDLKSWKLIESTFLGSNPIICHYLSINNGKYVNLIRFQISAVSQNSWSLATERKRRTQNCYAYTCASLACQERSQAIPMHGCRDICIYYIQKYMQNTTSKYIKDWIIVQIWFICTYLRVRWVRILSA